MTESRGAFRQRINTQYWATYDSTMRKAGYLGSIRAQEHAAEAVYAAALRDFRAYAGEAEYDPYPDMQATDLVDEYAASLGIDLEEKP